MEANSEVRMLIEVRLACIMRFISRDTKKCLLRLVVRTCGFHPHNSSSILLGDVRNTLVLWFSPHGKMHEKVEVDDLEVKNEYSIFVEVVSQGVFH